MATDAAVGRLFNIGNPEQVSINGLAERVIERTGSASDVVHLDYEAVYGIGYEDMERRVPNCDRVRELIGWTPQRDLDAIIDSVVAYRRSVDGEGAGGAPVAGARGERLAATGP
jgi:UDP-glucose 4-epimerase